MDLASREIARIPQLLAFLGTEDDGSVGWGQKRSGVRAMRNAAQAGKRCLLLEDGFLRSVERDDPPLSLVVDDLGIYYDASKPSRIESLIEQPLRHRQENRARSLIAAWRQGRVSKYNHAREYVGDLPRRYVLVVDQTHGDASIRHGRADETSFRRMIDAALTEHPECTVIVKTHPDVVARKKRGHFDRDDIAKNPRIRVLVGDCHPVRLIENAEVVYTVTSQMGFEALIWGKPVRCFGMPFYAGWGLTDDELPAPKRRGWASLEQLVHAALVGYPRYVDPETGTRCEVERILEYVSFQRDMRSRFPEQIYGVGFSRWKRPILRKFTAGSDIRFVRHRKKVPQGAGVAVWGKKHPQDLPEISSMVRVEDGFLRSVGLGADFTKPLSWIQDSIGIYYDASQESGLERILAETDFDKGLLSRAAALRGRIVSEGLSKYNSDTARWTRPADLDSVVLVPGQVEEDASIRFGALGIRTNLDLLQAVRKARPDSYIVYKPHPDVVARLRKGGKGEINAVDHCDEVIFDASLAQVFGQVDEVHTLTSLSGFEALLRKVPVTCYGLPFYAGWGLTTDIVPPPRRNRSLTLDELVAGCLILYPTYVSRVTGRFTTPERVIDELVVWRDEGVSRPTFWRSALRLVLSLAKGTYAVGVRENENQHRLG